MFNLYSPFGAIWWGLAGLLFLWVIFWKGLALWKAARLGHKGWFVALLIINTAGILDILYIYFFSRKDPFARTETEKETLS